MGVGRGAGRYPMSYKTLGGSFLAVSKSIFAIRHSCCNIARDLQDLHTFTADRFQVFPHIGFQLLHRSICDAFLLMRDVLEENPEKTPKKECFKEFPTTYKKYKANPKTY